MSIAKQRQSAEEPDLLNFILNKTAKSLSELIATTWKMHNALSDVEREQKYRLDVVVETGQKSCVVGCDGRWFECAWEVLRNNNINVFADALRQCLKVGRKKNNNIILTSPTNCGKTFLISLLEPMFDCFVNPAGGLRRMSAIVPEWFQVVSRAYCLEWVFVVAWGPNCPLAQTEKPIFQWHSHNTRKLYADIGHQ